MPNLKFLKYLTKICNNKSNNYKKILNSIKIINRFSKIKKIKWKKS